MNVKSFLVALLLVFAGSTSWNPAYYAGAVRGAGSAAGGPAGVLLAQQPAPKQQDEFVPIDQLPPQDQLPAAPLLIAAYAFVALALFAYVVSVARRLGTVQRELERLEADAKRSGRT